MNKSQARGYLLEIVVSYLIQINGYKLIRDDTEIDIEKKHNGLNVKGRGGYHQFDTLGNLVHTAPFIYPLRLFVEAKFYSNRVGIDIIRKGIGILQDVNTNYSTINMSSEELKLERYNYNYAVFSASGFTEGAERLALAHKIHLIDLSGSVYYKMLDLIGKITDAIFNSRNDIGSNEFNKFKTRFTQYILDCFVPNMAHLYLSNYQDLIPLAIKLKEEIEGRCIYFATFNTPYIIPIFADESLQMTFSANPHQKVSVVVTFEDSYKWTIKFDSNTQEDLNFKLPKFYHEYLVNILHRKNNEPSKSKDNFAGLSAHD